MKNSGDILSSVNAYYSDKIRQNGANNLGVDWNSKDSQYLRFEQIANVIKENNGFSLLDFGCGYGEMINFLESKYSDFTYRGFDISQPMLEKGKELFGKNSRYTFENIIQQNPIDYSVLSGVFNVKVDGVTN